MSGDENSRSVSSEVNSRAINDPLALSNSDHPGAQLVSNQFNGTNYLSWSRSIRMALGAKLKIGFIDGGTPMPALGTLEYVQWIRCDYMVRCWILNSMIGSNSEGFMYSNTAKQLWEEIAERFGQTNGPLVFQLRRELSSQVQENLSIAEYYGKRKRVWDEIDNLEGIPECTCGAIEKHCSCNLLKRILELQSKNRLMEFLLGLNDGFEAVRNQILTMEPLPSVNKAYYLAQQVERQKIVTCMVPHGESNALNAGRMFKGTTDGKGGDKSGAEPSKKSKTDKGDRECSNCNMKGHTVDQCFKLIGYPDWYMEIKAKEGGKEFKKSANTVASETVLDTPIGSQFTGESAIQNAHLDPAFVNTVCQELIRIMKGKGKVDEADMSHFSGP